MTSYAPIDIVPYWADANEHLIELVDLVPADKWNWSPEPRFWNFRGIFLHIIGARYFVVRDEDVPNYWRDAQTNEGLKEELGRSWAQLMRFVSDPDALDGRDPREGQTSQVFVQPEYLDPPVRNGHYVAWHRMVHDIHHRADILHYLDVLNVDLSSIPRRRPL